MVGEETEVIVDPGEYAIVVHANIVEEISEQYLEFANAVPFAVRINSIS